MEVQRCDLCGQDAEQGTVCSYDISIVGVPTGTKWWPNITRHGKACRSCRAYLRDAALVALADLSTPTDLSPTDLKQEPAPMEREPLQRTRRFWSWIWSLT